MKARVCLNATERGQVLKFPHELVGGQLRIGGAFAACARAMHVVERIADFLHQTRACDDAAGHSKYRDFCTRVTLGLFAADQFKF